jgi:DNA gyrase/topoisomerase IV subunit B
MTKDKTLYDKDSIESLSPLEFTRLRPGVYAGDCTYSTQLLVEIISNAVDEYRLGHGSKIDITINGDIVKVQDYGQGFLVNEMREDGKTVLEAAFSVLNTSGKYRSDGTYEGTSLGSFGIGSKITCFLAHWLNVTTVRDGKSESIQFEEGVFKDRKIFDTKSANGTTVEWQPSEEFFTNTIVEIDKIKSLFKTITCLCPGLTIELNDNGNCITYFSKNGINDLVDEAVKGKELINNRFEVKYANGKNKIDMVLTYTGNYSSILVPYVNTGLTEKGPHITQIKSLLTKEFNKFFRDKKWLKDKDENLTGDDIQEGMYIVFNITAPDVAYNAQVKSTITKIDMTPYISSVSEALNIWMKNNEKDVKMIADKAILAKKAREAAKKAKEAARNTAPKGKKQFLNLPSKLVDSWSKDRSKCELLIAEGDSAANGLVSARDGEIQAVFPIRGKILNLYKASSEKTFANQEVVNIIKALGLDLDPKTKKIQYDKSKLRYGKILLCADADPDGQAIKNLLLTCFWSLCPELVTNGHIYSTLPPLFRITTKKNEYIYLKDADALEEYKAQHSGEMFQINRNKGLGEQDASELAECLLNPATRNIAQITVEDVEAANKLFEVFMGPSAVPRKAWIIEHSEEANDI